MLRVTESKCAHTFFVVAHCQESRVLQQKFLNIVSCRSQQKRRERRWLGLRKLNLTSTESQTLRTTKEPRLLESSSPCHLIFSGQPGCHKPVYSVISLLTRTLPTCSFNAAASMPFLAKTTTVSFYIVSIFVQ